MSNAALYLVGFIGACGFAIVLPSLWPYLQSRDLSLSFLGIVVACFSVGQFIAAPLFGFLSNRIHPYYVIVVSLIIGAVGNLIYACVTMLPHPRVFFILSRILAGAAAGNIAVLRVCIVSTTESGRPLTMSLALLTGIQGSGYIIGPAFGALFHHINTSWYSIEFNKMTMPGFFGAFLCFSGILIIAWDSHRRGGTVHYHQAPTVTPHAEHASATPPQASGTSARGYSSVPFGVEAATLHHDHEPSMPLQQHAAHSSNQFRAVGVEDIDETTQGNVQYHTAPLVNDINDDSYSDDDDNVDGQSKRDARYSGASSTAPLLPGTSKQRRLSRKVGVALCIIIVFGISLVFTVFETVLTPYMQKAYGWEVGKTGVLFAGLGALSLITQALLILPRKVSDASLIIAGLVCQVASLAGLICYTLDEYVAMYRFLICSALLVIGFSMCNALIYTVFSRVHGKPKQGTSLGTLTSIAALARFLGPIAISPVFKYSYGFYVFMPICVFLLLTVLAPSTWLADALEAPSHSSRSVPKYRGPAPVPSSESTISSPCPTTAHVESSTASKAVAMQSPVRPESPFIFYHRAAEMSNDM
jgi:MFS family permease